MYIRLTENLAAGVEKFLTRQDWGFKSHLYRVQTPTFDDVLISTIKVSPTERKRKNYNLEDVLEKTIKRALRNKVISKEEATDCLEKIKQYEKEK